MAIGLKTWLQALAAGPERVNTGRMRLLKTVPTLAACMILAAPAAASANFLHVVTPGESLSSVAATDGLSVTQLAATNGISPGATLVSGATLAIPPKTGYVTAAPASTGTPAGDGDTDSDDQGAAVPSSAAVGSTAGVSTAGVSTAGVSSATGGSYVVQPGDTLSAIAARAGLSVNELAAANGLNPNAYLLSGTALRLGAGSLQAPTSSTATGTATLSQPVGVAAEGTATGAPYPTPERVTAGQISAIAAANGVPPSLADAIGWQESGFNNDLVSSAGARGVMQILPGTWNWINASLTPAPLAPNSAADNVRGGVLMLHSLLSATGGSTSMAAAGYYQGLPSVQRYGLFPDTQRYVNSVMSLASSFGGR